MRISDWSSDVCSSDLIAEAHPVKRRDRPLARRGFAVAAGGARPDLGRQPFGDRPGGIVALLRKIDGARWLKGEDAGGGKPGGDDRSEEHTSELQSLVRSSYAVFCLKKKQNRTSHVMTHIDTVSKLC